MTLGDISTKWQGSSPLSFELPDSPAGGGGTTSLPEPGSLALFGSTLLVLGLLYRRRNRG